MRKLRKMIIFILCICITAVFVLRIIGFKTYSIKTESMAPTLVTDDMVYIIPTCFESLKEGDIISYVIDNDGTIVTHRIISINSNDRTVSTKGDNNEYPDINPVDEENIIGRMVFKIPKIGKLDFLNNFLSNLKGDD